MRMKTNRAGLASNGYRWRETDTVELSYYYYFIKILRIRARAEKQI